MIKEAETVMTNPAASPLPKRTSAGKGFIRTLSWRRTVDCPVCGTAAASPKNLQQQKVFGVSHELA
jgi:hypothetical protein